MERKRCTGLGRGSSHSRTRSFFCRLEAWCQARSTSKWLDKRVGLSKSSREDGRRRACGMQSQKSIAKQRGIIRLPLLPPLTRCWNGSEGRRTWPPLSSLESHLSVYFVCLGAAMSCHWYHHRLDPHSHVLGRSSLVLELHRRGGSRLEGWRGAWWAALPSRSRST